MTTMPFTFIFFCFYIKNHPLFPHFPLYGKYSHLLILSYLRPIPIPQKMCYTMETLWKDSLGETTMNTILLEKNSSLDVTIVSNYFLDEYMAKANGEYVKIYLYLLRRCGSGMNISISNIADVFEYTEKDVLRALTYWEQIGLISLGFDDAKHLTRITLKDVRADAPLTFKYVPTKSDDTIILNSETTLAHDNSSIHTTSVTSSDLDPLGIHVVTPGKNINEEIAEAGDYDISPVAKKHSFSTDELTKLTSDSDIQELLYIAQIYLSKTLSPADTNTILYFYDGLKFNIELIEYLIDYCVSNNHKNLRYIEKVALDWASSGVTCVEEAKEHNSLYTGTYTPVLKAFGITGRIPGAIEKNLIDKWLKEYGFSMDIIVEACNRTILAIHTPSFKYADSILQRWLKKNVKTLDDLQKIDDEHNAASNCAKNINKNTHTSSVPKTKNNGFNTFPQRSYDYDALERELLRRK